MTLREQLGDVSMEATTYGVAVSIGRERYLAPWGTVQSVRYADAPKPGEVGGGPLVEMGPTLPLSTPQPVYPPPGMVLVGADVAKPSTGAILGTTPTPDPRGVTKKGKGR